MSEISLEKIDIIRKRFGVSYAEAKDVLEACNGDVVESLICLEKSKKNVKEEVFNSLQDFMKWLGSIIKKGNVSRIKIKKDDKNIVDIPVNAGLAAGVLAIIYPALIAVIGIGAVAAYVTNLTIEITKSDGSVQIVNKIIKNTASDVKDKVSNLASGIKSKFNEKKHSSSDDDNVYEYTVNFDNEESEKSSNNESNVNEKNE